jgi:hypothetical protein
MKQSFPIEAEDEDELKVFRYIQKSRLHRVATHTTVFHCADAILWIIRHVDLDNRYILNAKGKPIASFRAYDIASYYQLERGSLLLDKDLIRKFLHKEKDLFKIWYNPDKTFKIRPSRKYPTNLLRTSYRYIVAMLCRLHGEHDTSKFTLSMIPLIYYYANMGSTFN